MEKTYEYTVENRLEAVYDADELLVAMAYDGDGNRVFQLNYNLHTDEDWKGNSGNGNSNNKDNQGSGNNGKGSKSNGKGNSKSEGKEKNYELIEYINDVNREYTEVLVEQNLNGKLDTAYVYGNDRLSLDRFDGSNGYYLYDPRGSVTGITNEEGQIYQSYRYSVNGEITFGEPQYENEYTYNGESYNPNIESQYLRARYYDAITATFLTEDSYLGDINEPLSLNRYNYCVSSPLNYQDTGGNEGIVISGGIDEGAKSDYMFIETALHDINRLIDEGDYLPTEITWGVITAGYQEYQLRNFEKTADNLGIGFVRIQDKCEFVNYINNKNIENCETSNRAEDPIDYISVFSHGQTPKFSGSEETQLSFAYHIEGFSDDDAEKVNFKRSDIERLDSEAFVNTLSYFYACNIGTDDYSGTSFAQAWANKTNSKVFAIRNGRSEYSFINATGMNPEDHNVAVKFFNGSAYSMMDYVNKLKEYIYDISKAELFKPSEEWIEKMRRKEERNEKVYNDFGEEITKGYSDKGSLNLPVLTTIYGDKDIYLKGYASERGWKLFVPQKE